MLLVLIGRERFWSFMIEGGAVYIYIYGILGVLGHTVRTVGTCALCAYGCQYTCAAVIANTKNVRVGFACENGTDGLCFGSLIGIHVTKLCGKRVRVQRNTDSIQSKATPA